MSRFHIKTFGCQMNVADSERMAALLSGAGMQAVENAEEADILLINGCSVREKAAHKAVSALGTYQFFKAKEASGGKSGPLIGLGGCVGQLDQGRIFKQAPYLDFVFGTDVIDELPEIIHQVAGGQRHQVFTDFDRSHRYSTETKISGKKAQAFVNIMKGCDKFCTYCVVPFTRGREKSRAIDEVLDDVARLVEKGVREVTLLGQNVNSFGKGNPEENFPQLLRALDSDPRLAELKRIRFTSSHPLDFSNELIDCYAPPEHGGVQKLARHLHLPVQSGSNTVLQKMGRHHQIENYVAQIERLKALDSNVALSTDFIVGFPGETDSDFAKTLALMDRLQFDSVFAFAYSERPGTKAANIVDNVPESVKNERLNQLLKHQQTIAESRYLTRVGKVMEVLVEGTAKFQHIAASADTKVWTGRTSCNRVVNFASDVLLDLTGRFVDVKITGSTSLSLTGEPIFLEESR